MPQTLVLFISEGTKHQLGPFNPHNTSGLNYKSHFISLAVFRESSGAMNSALSSLQYREKEAEELVSGERNHIAESITKNALERTI